KPQRRSDGASSQLVSSAATGSSTGFVRSTSIGSVDAAGSSAATGPASMTTAVTSRATLGGRRTGRTFRSCPMRSADANQNLGLDGEQAAHNDSGGYFTWGKVPRRQLAPQFSHR